MNPRPISEKRQKLLDEKNSAELKVGDKIGVKYNAVNEYTDEKRKDQSVSCIIIDIADKIKVRHTDNSVYKKTYFITKEDIVYRDLLKIGENPFNERLNNIRPIAFVFSTILFQLNILGTKRNVVQEYKFDGVSCKELNWNPYVYNKEGKKEYYQRPFVWTLKDKQTLIESVYQGIDCGKILVRKRSWEEIEAMRAKGETDLAFNDIVDGKQRLDAMRGFIQLEYADANGNYYSDLSFYSQMLFVEHQLFSYAEMPENTKDKDVIYQFLRMNFTGVPQSTEHVNFVKSLQTNL